MVRFFSGAASAAFAAGGKIKWGILSAGKISSDFAKAIAITDGAEVRRFDEIKTFQREEFFFILCS